MFLGAKARAWNMRGDKWSLNLAKMQVNRDRLRTEILPPVRSLKVEPFRICFRLDSLLNKSLQIQDLTTLSWEKRAPERGRWVLRSKRAPKAHHSDNYASSVLLRGVS